MASFLASVMSNKSALIATSALILISAPSFAADTVIVEPEPINYVRVCDAYGSGFFYIPGTETCMRFGGYIRSSREHLSIEADDNSLVNGLLLFPNFLAGGEKTSFESWGSSAQIYLDTRNETDWGTLRASIRLQANRAQGSGVNVDAALFSIAGFRAGFSGANYWSSNHDFGWVNSESVSENAAGIGVEDGFYGFDDALVFDYTWASNGWAFTVGTERPRLSYGRDNLTNAFNPAPYYNFYAGLNYSASWGSFAFTAVHDSAAPEISVFNPGVFGGSIMSDRGGVAYKASININLSDYIEGASIWGTYMYDGDYNTDYVHANGLLENPEQIWGVAYQMDIGSEFQFWANYWDVKGGTGHVFNNPGLPLFFGGNQILGTNIQEGGLKQFGIGLNWYPEAAPGLHVKASYFRGEVDNSGHVLVCDGFGFPARGCDFDYEGFTIAVGRSF